VMMKKISYDINQLDHCEKPSQRNGRRTKGMQERRRVGGGEKLGTSENVNVSESRVRSMQCRVLS